jgi:MurNAc alpha-1-phosphate uridylyltransferase
MGVYHPDFFLNAPKVEFCLGDWLRVKASSSKITGEIYLGLWHNIGTIEQLQQLEA